jgi:hypothetical protein
MSTRLLHASAFMAVLAAACASEDADQLSGGANVAPPAPPGAAPGDPANPGGPGTVDPATCGGKEFKGFDGENLVRNRVVANIGVDRGRFKPYDALAAEYNRVLGNTPASLAAAGDTFGKPEARWYDEPAIGGVVLQTSFKIAFDGCLTYTQTPAEFGVAPTAATASTKCADMARSFWSRTASPDQITACSDVALTGAAKETDPRRRWAYACASVLNAAGFMTY